MHRRGRRRLRALRVIVAHRPQRQLSHARLPGREPRQGLSPPLRPQDYAGQEGARRRRRRLGARVADRAGAGRRRRDALYRNKEFARPKPENVDKLRALEQDPHADVQIEKPVSERVTTRDRRATCAQEDRGTVLRAARSKLQPRDRARDSVDAHRRRRQGARTLPNDVVFAMIGREAPLDFFRRSGIPIRGEWRAATSLGFAAFFAFCFFVYTWKAGTAVNQYFQRAQAVSLQLPESLGAGAARKSARRSRCASPASIIRSPIASASSLFGWTPDPATENALRHAPDLDADRGSGHSAVRVALFRPALDGQRGTIRSRALEDRSAITCSPLQLRYGRDIGARSASSWPGRCSSGTSSTRSR